MNNRLAFCSLLLCVCLLGCSSKDKPGDSDLAAIKEYARAEVKIERMRKRDNPDWDAVIAQYEITSTIVRKVDSKQATDYDRQIREALKKCKAGEKVKVNQQTLAKGLQHVTVLAIREELNTIGGSASAERKVVAQRIAAYFEGIRPTFIRRDKDFFGEQKTLETSADAAIKRLKSADSSGLPAAHRDLEDAIGRTYGLSILYEVMEIEKLRDSDLNTCDVKRKEAEIFYRIIEARVKKRSAKTHAIISNMLSGSYDTMDAAVISEYLKTGLGGLSLQ